MIDIDDVEQVEKCLAGNSRAFETIIGKYQKALFTVAFRMVGNYQDAEDIVQTAFIKAYNSLKRYNPRYKFFSWIYRITVNESINHVKKKKNNETGLEDTISSSEDPGNIYDRKEMEERIQGVLSKIEPKYRILIVLCQLQDYSYQQAGQILNIDEKKVKSRLYSARQQIRDLLKKEGIENNVQ